MSQDGNPLNSTVGEKELPGIVEELKATPQRAINHHLR